MSSSSSRPSPIIVITGTPGTGKSTHAELLASESPVPLRHINVGQLVKERGLYEGYDEEWESYEVDEDKVHFLTPFPFLSSCSSLASFFYGSGMKCTDVAPWCGLSSNSS